MTAVPSRRSTRNSAAKPGTWRAVRRLVEGAIAPGERKTLLDRFNAANYARMPARQLWELGTGPWHDADVGGELVHVRAIVKLGALNFFTVLQAKHGGFVGEPNGQFYELLAQQINGTRSAAKNGRLAKSARTSCRNGGDVYYDVVDVSTEEGWRYIVMGKAKYNPLKNFAVVECRYGEPKCKLLRQFATRDKAHDYKYDLAVKLHDGQ